MESVQLLLVHFMEQAPGRLGFYRYYMSCLFVICMHFVFLHVHGYVHFSRHNISDCIYVRCDKTFCDDVSTTRLPDLIVFNSSKNCSHSRKSTNQNIHKASKVKRTLKAQVAKPVILIFTFMFNFSALKPLSIWS